MTDQGAHPSREDLAAFALGALEPAAAAELEMHVRACAVCQPILAEYQTVTREMLFAVPPHAPPPQLRSMLAEQIAGGKALPRFEPARKEQGLRTQAAPGQRRFSLLQLGFSLALIALLVLNAFLGLQIRSLREQQKTLLKLIQDNQSRLAMISQPGVRALPVSGPQGEGNLVISQDGTTAVLFLRNLPAIASDQTYQVWLIPGEGAPQSAGLFQGQADQPYLTVLVTSQIPLIDYAAIGISVEPSGGSSAPTTDPIVVVNL